MKRRDRQVGGVCNIAIAPDGQQVLAAGEDDSFLLWELETGREFHWLHGHTGFVNTVAFALDDWRAWSGNTTMTIRPPLKELAVGAPDRIHGGMIRSRGTSSRASSRRGTAQLEPGALVRAIADKIEKGGSFTNGRSGVATASLAGGADVILTA